MRYTFLIATAAVLALGAETGSAHAFLQSAVPAVGSTVAQAPGEVAITFTEGVEPRFSAIVVRDADGKRMDKADPHLAGDDTHLAVSLGALPPGRYTVVWHATATDTHKTQGKYNFTVGTP